MDSGQFQRFSDAPCVRKAAVGREFGVRAINIDVVPCGLRRLATVVRFVGLSKKKKKQNDQRSFFGADLYG